VKKIKLDQGKLLGFKILQQTPKIGSKPGGATSETAIQSKIGGKIGVKPDSRLGAKIGAKVGFKHR